MIARHAFSSFIKKRLSLALALGIAVFSIGAIVVQAVPPTSPYNPGDTLDPACAPGTTNCTVNTIASGSVSVTNGLQILGSDVGLGGTLTETSTFIDSDGINENALYFGAINPLSEFAVLTSSATGGSGEIVFQGEGFSVDTTAQQGIDLTTATNSTNGSAELKMGSVTIPMMGSVNGVNFGYTYEAPSTDVYTSSLLFADVAGLGNAPVTQLSVTNDTQGDGLFLRMGNIGSMGLELGYNSGSSTTSMSLANGTIAFNVANNNTFSVPTSVGTNGYVLQTDGSGTTSWVDPSTFGGGAALYVADTTDSTVYIGENAGDSATNITMSNVFGYYAGTFSSDIYSSTVIGSSAGASASNVSEVVAIGPNAAGGASAVQNSVFIGRRAGENASTINNSVFVGSYAGANASTAAGSVFFGYNAGNGALSAANSLFFGTNAGLNDTANNTALYDDVTTFADTSILLGHGTSTGGFSNSIALGAYATNTAANQLVIGSMNRPISELVMTLNNSGDTCVIDSTGLTCPSDENLKTDITGIPNALDLVTKLDGVTYHWKTDTTASKKIPGFIAQDVEQIIPEAVVYNETTGRYAMNYTQIIPYLVEAIKQINTAVNLGTTTGAEIGELVVQRLRAHEVCLDDLCIDRDDLEKILNATGVDANTDALDAGDEEDAGADPDQGHDNGQANPIQPVETPENPQNTGDSQGQQETTPADDVTDDNGATPLSPLPIVTLPNPEPASATEQ